MGEAIDAGRGPAAGKLDAVFEGGGVRGIGLVGAISVAEAAGYQFENVAGTSAGAIVATLLACGYNAAELKQTIGEIDFRSLTDLNGIGRIPIAGVLSEHLLVDVICLVYLAHAQQQTSIFGG